MHGGDDGDLGHFDDSFALLLLLNMGTACVTFESSIAILSDIKCIRSSCHFYAQLRQSSSNTCSSAPLGFHPATSSTRNIRNWSPRTLNSAFNL